MKALTRGRRHRVIHGQRRQRGWETPAPVCRDVIGLGLQYRLLPHMIARRFDHWSFVGIDPFHDTEIDVADRPEGLSAGALARFL